MGPHGEADAPDVRQRAAEPVAPQAQHSQARQRRRLVAPLRRQRPSQGVVAQVQRRQARHRARRGPRRGHRACTGARQSERAKRNREAVTPSQCPDAWLCAPCCSLSDPSSAHRTRQTGAHTSTASKEGQGGGAAAHAPCSPLPDRSSVRSAGRLSWPPHAVGSCPLSPEWLRFITCNPTSHGSDARLRSSSGPLAAWLPTAALCKQT